CHHQESRARRKTGQSRSLDHRLYSRCRVLALSLHPPFLLTNATRLARCFTRRQAEPASMTRLRRAKRFHDGSYVSISICERFPLSPASHEEKSRATDPALTFAAQRPAISPTPRQSELHALKKYFRAVAISGAIRRLD